jgi:hypothetical protein
VQSREYSKGYFNHSPANKNLRTLHFLIIAKILYFFKREFLEMFLGEILTIGSWNCLL